MATKKTNINTEGLPAMSGNFSWQNTAQNKPATTPTNTSSQKNVYGMSTPTGDVIFNNPTETAPLRTTPTITTRTTQTRTTPQSIPTQTPVGATATEPTIGSALKETTLSDYEDPYADYRNELERSIKQEIDPDALYRQKLNQWQGYMDSLKSVYADKFADVDRLTGQRLGTNRAQQARSGIIGSTFGEAQKSKINEYGLEEKRSLQNEMDMKLQYLMGEIDRDVTAQIAEQRRLMREDRDKYLELIGKDTEIKVKRVQDFAARLLSEGIENFEDLSPEAQKEFATKLRTPVEDVRFQFNTLKAQQLAEAQKAAMEGAFNLSEGQARYDANGNLIASRGKTSGGTTGGGSETYSGTSFSQTAIDWANRIRTGQATIANVPSKERSEVISAMQSLPDPRVRELDNIESILETIYNNPSLGKLTGAAGQLVPAVGGDAAVFRNKFNQLKGILSLEGRQALKGSGAISDFEFRVLEQAASALGRNLNKENFKKEIELIKNTIQDRKNEIISGNTYYQNNQVSTTSGVLRNPDGTMEVNLTDLTPAEIQEARNAGWK